jgi:hypothetical protein
METGTEGINIQSLQSGGDGCKLQGRTTTFCAPFPRYFTSKRHTIHDNLCVKGKALSYQTTLRLVIKFVPEFSSFLLFYLLSHSSH